MLSQSGSGGNRFNDRGANRGGFNERRGNNNMDRRSGNGNGMRDYVDPWAHNGNNGNSPMMGGGNGPLTSFGSMGNGNNGMGNMNLGNNSGPNNQNNGGGFGNNMDIDKTSTQVTIPKDVSPY